MMELRSSVDDMGSIFSKIYDELRTVPITLMFMAGIYVAVAILWSDHVSKADFLGLKAEFQEQTRELHGLKTTLQRDHADSRLHSVEQELFNLAQHKADEKTKGHLVDSLYDQRINDLQNQQADLLRELARIDQYAALNK